MSWAGPDRALPPNDSANLFESPVRVRDEGGESEEKRRDAVREDSRSAATLSHPIGTVSKNT